MPGIQIVIDCTDAARLVQFWSLAGVLRCEDAPEYARFSVTLADPEGNEF
jgi:hypothetical protein